MLRTTITKFKRTYTLAYVPRILQGNVWCPAGNFEKLSAILMTKYKSTTTGSNDDEDKKSNKCKRLIELAFGSEKSPDLAKNKVVCEQDRIGTEGDCGAATQDNMQNILNATKVEEEEKIVPRTEKIEAGHLDAKREKCKQLIELMFGPEKPENAEDSKISNLPELEADNVTQLVPPGFTKPLIMHNKRNSSANEGISGKEIDSTQPNIQNVLNATKEEDDEKLIQKIENVKETPLVDADIKTKMPFSNKHIGSKGLLVNDSKNMFDELAKRCVNSRDDKIDSKILKEIKGIDISQPISEDFQSNISNNAQTSKVKSKKETHHALEKDKIKLSRRNLASRRAMKHLALRMGSDHFSDVTSSENKSKLNMKTSKKDLSTKPCAERNSRAEREILMDREKPLNITVPVAVKAVKTIEKLNTERTEFDHKPLIKCGEDETDSPVLEEKNEELEATNKADQNKSILTSDESTRHIDEPAVLVKECDDPDGFRITPHTPKAETLADRLQALNNQVQQATLSYEYFKPENVEQRDKEEQVLSTKEDESSKLNKQTNRLFTDERIPRHLFASLAIISKNLPTDTEIGKSLKDFYEQDLEKDTTLIKPDRLRYYSHNDEIVEFRDCTQEKDPHVVIKEYEDYESNPSDTDPYSNYDPESNYSNNQENMYYGRNMYQNNMPSDNSGMSQDYNRIMTNVPHFTAGYYNTCCTVTPSNMQNSVSIGNNNISTENGYVTNKCNTNHPISSTYNPNKVLIDPYGKNMKTNEWEESEDINQNAMMGMNQENHNNSHWIHTNRRTHDLPLDPLLTSRFAVNDGTLVSGNESKTDHNESQVNRMTQQSQNVPPQTIGNPWVDKGTVSTGSMKCNAYIEAQEPVKISQMPVINPKEVKISQMPVINPKEEPMTLSEMLRKARERARLEAYRQEVLIAAPVTEVDPTEGSCKKPKPPCPPPQKTCPPTPPKCPPSNCPEPQPPCPKPCKPECPDPCSTPKCPPAPKKDPCAKFVSQKTVDILGLVVTLGTLNIRETAAVNKLSNEKTNVIPMLVEDMLLRLCTITDGVLMPKIKGILEDEEHVHLLDSILERSFYFPKDYEPWTPIPSWPIPVKREKNKLVCPKDGCKIPPPPPPGARCKNIHHPCAGFPNDKKRT